MRPPPGCLIKLQVKFLSFPWIWIVLDGLWEQTQTWLLFWAINEYFVRFLPKSELLCQRCTYWLLGGVWCVTLLKGQGDCRRKGCVCTVDSSKDIFFPFLWEAKINWISISCYTKPASHTYSSWMISFHRRVTEKHYLKYLWNGKEEELVVY